MLEAGITPFVTLYHWDLPQALQDEGGWPARTTAQAFVEYADGVSRHLGDRVKQWLTHNEPWTVAFAGYQMGAHAPGWRGWPAALRTVHLLLLSHGWAVPVLRRNRPEAQVGISLNLTHVVPATRSVADLNACRRLDGHVNRWFLDPLYGRRYPADMVADHLAQGRLPAAGLDCVQDGDFAVQRAIQNGVPLSGFFVWSPMDNMEWAQGYAQRFGVVCIDYQTQRRAPKDSALWYRDVIARNGLRS